MTLSVLKIASRIWEWLYRFYGPQSIFKEMFYIKLGKKCKICDFTTTRLSITNQDEFLKTKSKKRFSGGIGTVEGQEDEK